jgi:hypothetical protein
LAGDERPKRGRAGHGRRRDAPRGHPAHPCRPRTPRATRRYKKPPPQPQGSPNPSRLGEFNPLPTYPQARGEGEGGEKEDNGGARSSTTRREAGAAREEEPDPREPSTPATPIFLGFPFIASSICFPYQHHRLPRHRVAHPFTDACTSASGHRGENTASSLLWTPRSSSQAGMRSFAGAAAFVDARATRLAYPSSCRTPPCLVAFASRARPCGPRRSRVGVHPSTRAP